ncbi:MAG: RagB/SusD family nutrient uptake outer membrane protein, partial [Bacteroidota bacterium]
RGRELLWEGLRRTDLIRFNRFIEGDYLWPYKGGPVAGQAINPKFKVYPLPLSDLIPNPNLTQNDGY